MSRSKIEWTDETWNPVTGCTKISAGCKHCYAERQAHRYWGDRQFTDIRVHEDRLDYPLRWRKTRMVFVNSMSDLFHSEVPVEFIARAWGVMQTKHTFQVLTKRPQRMMEFVNGCRDGRGLGWMTHNGNAPSAYGGDGIIVGQAKKWPRRNVWLGVSVEDQATANDRVPILLSTFAAVRWVSVEPILGPVDLLGPGFFADRKHMQAGGLIGLDWVVCGCESGPKARPMDIAWVRDLRDQCVTAGVPFFLKQMVVDGRLVKMPELDGRVWAEYPKVKEVIP